MSTQKCTPGPWRHRNGTVFRDSGAPLASEEIAVCFIASKTLIAIKKLRENVPVAPLNERAANANLIAAAPDLLEACRNVFECEADLPYKTVGLLTMALNKAEGWTV